MFWLKQKIMTPGARPFEMGREEDAGYDIFSTEDGKILPLTSVAFRTGIATAFTPGYVGLVLDRSSVGWKGIMRQAGVIDSGFRDEWFVKLWNTSIHTMEIESVIRNKNAKAIAQVVFVPYGKVPPEIVDLLPPSLRGEGQLGSTDAK